MLGRISKDYVIGQKGIRRAVIGQNGIRRVVICQILEDFISIERNGTTWTVIGYI